MTGEVTMSCHLTLGRWTFGVPIWSPVEDEGRRGGHKETEWYPLCSGYVGDGRSNPESYLYSPSRWGRLDVGLVWTGKRLGRMFVLLFKSRIL